MVGQNPGPDLLSPIRAAASELVGVELATPILVGVSGGPDSLALLHALWRWRETGGPAVIALHVDHRLRPESAAEAGRVAAWCADRGVPFTGRAVSLGAPPVANIEQMAREARYACFAEEAARTGARVLALAHHADDQAETLLLHLLRGAGLAGLAGMPVARRAGDLLDPLCAALGVPRPAVWRPLLAVRRAAILTYCRRWGLEPLHDPSNDDTTLRRNALRHIVLPALETHFPGAAGILARDAALLAADEEYLRRATAEALNRCGHGESGLALLDRPAFRSEPVALQRRVLRAAWGLVQGRVATVGLDADTLEVARAAVIGGKTGATQHLPGDLLLLIDRDTAALGPRATLAGTLRRRLRLPMVEPGWSRPLTQGGGLALGDGWTVVSGEGDGAAAPALHIPGAVADTADLVFRTWQPGDRVTLHRGCGSRKLQDWFTDRHIPGYARRHLPLLALGSRVIWVVGLASFPPISPDPRSVDSPAGRGGIALRLLYNSSPVDVVQHR